MRVSVLLSVLFVAFLTVSGFGQTAIGVNYTAQPSKSSLISWASGSYVTKDRASVAMPCRGFDVYDTSSGGNLKVHLVNDFDASGRKIWTTYKIPASNGSIQRVGLIFDAIDSAGTTIAIGGIILWY